mgnify:FL=1
MAINSNVSQFLSKIKQGVKPNMYQVSVNWPSELDQGKGAPDKDLVNILCKSAALPASNLGVIEVPFRGRTVKIAGDRTFDTWSATFINDEDLKIRSYFEEWLAKINSHENNASPLFRPSSSSEGYMANLSVNQLEKNSTTNGGVIREYTLWHAFPTSVSQIDLAYDSNDQVSEFSVEFQLSYWTAERGTAAESQPPNIKETVASAS